MIFKSLRDGLLLRAQELNNDREGLLREMMLCSRNSYKYAVMNAGVAVCGFKIAIIIAIVEIFWEWQK